MATSSVEPRLFAVIPAAGSGSRFDARELKQYAPLCAATVLEHSAAALLKLPTLQKMVIAIHANDARAATLPWLQDARVQFVTGGEERADSVLAALTTLQNIAAEDDWVLVHDAARPCLAEANLRQLIDALSQDTVGGILAAPATDTLKQVENGAIIKTVDRSAIWQAQTPQMFRFKLLFDALQQARIEKKNVTDEASAMELAGHAVKIVEGARSNIKITYPEDLSLAAFYLERGESV